MKRNLNNLLNSKTRKIISNIMGFETHSVDYFGV
jgi:hypothetical protein